MGGGGLGGGGLGGGGTWGGDLGGGGVTELLSPFWGGRSGGGDSIPPERILGNRTCAQEATSANRRRRMGSSVASKTIGTFVSQKMRQEDGHGEDTNERAAAPRRQAKAGAMRAPPDLPYHNVVLQPTYKIRNGSDHRKRRHPPPPAPPHNY